jgi:hypothetical protein
MPKGPGTYGSRVGRPKKRKRKMNEQKLEELIGESIWNTYSNLACILLERSALPRIDQEGDVDVDGAYTDDEDAVSSTKRRRGELAKHLKNIRKGKAKPEQETDDKARYDKDRAGPKGSGTRTHAQAAGDIKSDLMGSRGRESEENRAHFERAVKGREEQAVKSAARKVKK